jgi:hypothetical protein
MRVARWLFVGAIVTAMIGAAEARSPGKAAVDLVKNPTTEMVVAVPNGSPLTLKKMDMDGVHFAGQVRLTGEYVYGYESSYVSDTGWRPEADLYFVPDAASRALLPYSHEDGPAYGLRLSNRDAFLSKALSRTTISKIAARKIQSVRGRLTIWIDRYTVSVSCGTASYTAHFLRFESPREVVASSRFAQPAGCG